MKKKIIFGVAIALAVVGMHVATINASSVSGGGGGSGSVSTGTIATLGSPLTVSGSSSSTIAGDGSKSTIGGPLTVNGSITANGSPMTISGSNPSTITGDGTISTIGGLVKASGFTAVSTAVSNMTYISFNATVYDFPSPTLLAAGFVCGTGAPTTDVGTCVNNFYAASATSASTTEIVFPGYKYSASSWLTPIAIGNQGQLIQMTGQPGNATLLTYGNTTGTAITINDCNSNNKRKATQLDHLDIAGTSATSTGGGLTLIQAGGSNGACDTTFDDLTMLTAYKDLYIASNTYMFTLTNSHLLDAQQLMYVGQYSNSGESLNFTDDEFVDPATPSHGGNSSSSNCIYFDTNGSASTNFVGGSMDNCQLVVGAGNNVSLYGIHQENPGYPTFGSYTYDVVSSSAAGNTVLNIFAGDMVQDASSSTQVPPSFINTGAALNVFGTEVNRIGNATTVARFADNSISPANSIISVSHIDPVNNPFTNIIAGNALPAGTGVALVSTFVSNGNSWMAGNYMDTANVDHFLNGGSDQFKITTNGVSAAGLTLTGNGSSFTTGSMGGGSLTAGTCASTTTALNINVVTSTSAFATTPTVDPGPDFYWETVLIASSSVSTRVCAAGITGTPTASTYNVKVVE